MCTEEVSTHVLVLSVKSIHPCALSHTHAVRLLVFPLLSSAASSTLGLEALMDND